MSQRRTMKIELSKYSSNIINCYARSIYFATVTFAVRMVEPYRMYEAIDDRDYHDTTLLIVG